MSNTIQAGSSFPTKYVDPTPMPASVPHVEEVGATSAPLKSAAFFLGAYCKEYNGSPPFSVLQDCANNENFYFSIEDFMLCKNENRSPAHCLKEGRKVTRCAVDL